MSSSPSPRSCAPHAIPEPATPSTCVVPRPVASSSSPSLRRPRACHTVELAPSLSPQHRRPSRARKAILYIFLCHFRPTNPDFDMLYCHIAFVLLHYFDVLHCHIALICYIAFLLLHCFDCHIALIRYIAFNISHCFDMLHYHFSRSTWRILRVLRVKLCLAMRRASGMTEVWARMNLLGIQVHPLKGSDLLAHRMRIAYHKMRYTSIRN
jgi:glycosyltransferase involved in cell wall biosynthesis